MITQTFVPTAELLIPTETESNEADAEMETQPVTVEDRISKSSA